MAREPPNIQGGVVYHVVNRTTARAVILVNDADYAAFERALAEARRNFPLRILTYVLMRSHFHLVLWPRRGQEELLSNFMRWVALTHTRRSHACHHIAGTGELYQGPSRRFPSE